MHETLIAQDIIKEANKYGKVLAIVVEVGELAHIPAEELDECLKSLVDWKVLVNETPSVVSCICGYEGRPRILEKGHDSTMFACPECKAVMPEIISGTDIVLKEVEVE
ncbi:hydrogenase maturation nickel metallochaperone HypA [Candidatus Woesearchaeota archaeon]|nr:hydrogenase maturation nickel metallochaperone HypA [Candidatus Woesearchaeota archaeon]MBW3017279.1 hydrogenase maturation nickel metallochaperone HypA [Candidatus Woesearchaeota archaeon]